VTVEKERGEGEGRGCRVKNDEDGDGEERGWRWGLEGEKKETSVDGVSRRHQKKGAPRLGKGRHPHPSYTASDACPLAVLTLQRGCEGENSGRIPGGTLLDVWTREASTG
jgi:hypothetical protein